MAQTYSQAATGAALQALCAIAARNSNDAAVRNMTGCAFSILTYICHPNLGDLHTPSTNRAHPQERVNKYNVLFAMEV